MLCEFCEKEEANIYYAQVINGEVTKMHLCESCAEEKGMGGISFSKGILSNFPGFVLVELLAELTNLGIVSHKEKVKCNHCGLSYHDFKQTGRLGCSECYKVFRTNLTPLLKRIHGKTEHIGKIPSKANVKINFRRELFSMQRELQDAIAREEYERAAQIRDKIHASKKENGNQRAD